MDNRHEEHMYTYKRVKLSSLYKEIGDFLKEHGDADVRSIGSCSYSSDNTRFSLDIADLNSFNSDSVDGIKEIRIKYEDVPYTKEEWQNGEITVSKIDTTVHI